MKLQNLIPLTARPLPIRISFLLKISLVAIIILTLSSILNFFSPSGVEVKKINTLKLPSLLGILNSLESNLPDNVRIESLVVAKDYTRICYSSFNNQKVKIPESLKKLGNWIKK